MKERFARLAPVRDVDRVTSGSPAVLALSLPPRTPVPRTIDAMLALARRGMTMLRAKRAIEALVEHRAASVSLPKVEDLGALLSELARAGVEASMVRNAQKVDVKEVRTRLGLNREQFALRYGLEQETVRNWENGKREPDAAVRSYLRAISNDPVRVAEAYAPRRNTPVE